MADYDCISAVGRSIEKFLNAALDEIRPVPDKSTQAHMIRTEDFNATEAGGIIHHPALSIFLYRVDYNKTMRAAWSAVASHDGRARLPLDLHFLLTPWAENADYELRILGCAMQRLESMPILSGPMLDPEGGWAIGEALQISLEEISTENLMRIFDSLPVSYKLSVAYIVRVIRLDERRATPDPRVTTLKVKAG